jgi:hypothetical protein
MTELNTIETPLSSGTTDNPNASQSNTGRNEASAVAAGYPTQHGAPDYAALAQKYGVTLSAQTAVANSTPANAPANSGGTNTNAAPKQLDYASIAQKHGVSLTPAPTVNQAAQSNDQSTPQAPKSALDKVTDVASGFYDQTVGAGVNLVKKLSDDTAAYYKAHPGREYLNAIPGAPIIEAGRDIAKNYLFKDAAKDPQHPLARIAEGIIDSHVATQQKSVETQQAATEALKNGDYKSAALLYAQAQGFGAAAMIPMVGPAAAGIGEHIQNPQDLYRGAGETTGLIASILAPSYIGSKIMPRDVPVAGENVPVRASVAEPGFINQTAEALANKRMLQNFDVSDTQSAARDSIANAATSTVRNPELIAARDALKQGAIGDFNDAIDRATGKVPAGAQGTAVPTIADAIKEGYAQGIPSITKLGGRVIPNIAQIDSAYNTAIAAANGDFGAVAKALNESVSPLFEKASQQSIADGGSSWKEMAEARDAAFRRGDVTEMNAIKAKMKSSFEKVNSTGSFDVANRLYAKLDDINRINDVFKSNAVVKPTPVDFAEQNRTAAGVDAGIIDGKALRTAVRKLNEDGTFKNAGVSQDTVNDLQRLGEWLERSKVKPGMASVGWFGTAGRILKGVTGADRGLAYLMTHPDELKTAIGIAQVGAGVVNNQATHRYDESSAQVVPIQ